MQSSFHMTNTLAFRFQYVSCQFEELRRLQQAPQIRQALKNLPKGLDATYERMLSKVDPGFHTQVLNVLRFLVVSFRPPMLSELAEVFIIDCDKPVPFDRNDRLFKPESVLDYLSGLVTIYIPLSSFDHRPHGPGRVTFAHFSVKEYLVSQRIRYGAAASFSVVESEAHIHVAESCLAYHLQLSETELATMVTVEQNAFWDYATRHGIFHLDQSSEELSDRIVDRALQIFTPGTKALLNIVRLVDHDHPSFLPRWNLGVDGVCAPLYWAAARGAIWLTLSLIGKGANLNEHSPSCKFDNALQAAVVHRRESIVRLLLEKGADANIQGGSLSNPLYTARILGHENIRDLLKEHLGINLMEFTSFRV